MKKLIAFTLSLALLVGIFPLSLAVSALSEPLLSEEARLAEKEQMLAEKEAVSLLLTDEKLEGKQGVLSYLIHEDEGYVSIEACDTAAGGAVTVPDSIEGYPVRKIAVFAFYQCSSITMLTLPKSVDSIESYAFAGCSGLRSVNVPSAVTEIGTSAFSDCKSLKTVDLPDGLKDMGDTLFWNCTSLTSIEIPSAIQVLKGGTFKGCSSLATVTLPEGMTEIEGEAFRGCSALADVAVPDSVYNVGPLAFADTAWEKNQPDGVVYVGKVAYTIKGAVPATVSLKQGTASIATGFLQNDNVAKTLILPGSLNVICTKAIVDSKLEKICYEGTENEAKKIVIAEANDDLKNLTWQYNYCYASGTTHDYEGEKDEDCGSCGYLRKLFTPGDLDENEIVNSADAIYLLYYTLFGEERYPVNQPVDYDNNDAVNSADAIYLLYYTLFGADRYPI